MFLLTNRSCAQLLRCMCIFCPLFQTILSVPDMLSFSAVYASVVCMALGSSQSPVPGSAPSGHPHSTQGGHPVQELFSTAQVALPIPEERARVSDAQTFRRLRHWSMTRARASCSSHPGVTTPGVLSHRVRRCHAVAGPGPHPPALQRVMVPSPPPAAPSSLA